MASDIEIAQAAKMQRISKVALDKLGIAEEHLEPYGHYKAKVSLEYVDSLMRELAGRAFVVRGAIRVGQLLREHALGGGHDEARDFTACVREHLLVLKLDRLLGLGEHVVGFDRGFLRLAVEMLLGRLARLLLPPDVVQQSGVANQPRHAEHANGRVDERVLALGERRRHPLEAVPCTIDIITGFMDMRSRSPIIRCTASIMGLSSCPNPIRCHSMIA